MQFFFCFKPGLVSLLPFVYCQCFSLPWLLNTHFAMNAPLFCYCRSELVLLDCSLDCFSLLLVSRSLFDVDIDDPPFSAMLATGLAAILSLFLRGCDVLSTRCCLTFFLCRVFHLQQMAQFRNTRTMVNTVILC